jgi:hypothetical protein
VPPTARLFGPDTGCDAVSFTPAEVAVLRLIADVHRDQGGGALSIDEIAAQAGVCRRTALQRYGAPSASASSPSRSGGLAGATCPNRAQDGGTTVHARQKL